MPRHARLDYPGGLYHLINRGIERREIFLCENDYRYFKDIIGELVEEEQVQCYAWALMPNHFHLLIVRGATPIATFMSRLLTRYAVYYNRKYKRSGHLFQNRYKSVLCDKDSYLKKLVAYIHLNPVKAKIVKGMEGLANYPWTGHRALLGMEKNKWQNIEEILGLFGQTEKQAKTTYERYLCEQKDENTDLSGGGLIRSGGTLEKATSHRKLEQEMYDDRILGRGDFVEKVLNQMDEKDRIQTKLKRSMTIEELIAHVSQERGVKPVELYKKGKTTRKATECRAICLYLGVNYMEESVSSLSKKFQICQPSGSVLYRKGEKLSNAEMMGQLGITI